MLKAQGGAASLALGSGEEFEDWIKHGSQDSGWSKSDIRDYDKENSFKPLFPLHYFPLSRTG